MIYIYIYFRRGQLLNNDNDDICWVLTICQIDIVWMVLGSWCYLILTKSNYHFPHLIDVYTKAGKDKGRYSKSTGIWQKQDSTSIIYFPDLNLSNHTLLNPNKKMLPSLCSKCVLCTYNLRTSGRVEAMQNLWISMQISTTDLLSVSNMHFNRLSWESNVQD